MKLPARLKKQLAEDHDFEAKVNYCVGTYSEIPDSNRMYFFPEYTDHGIGHIERVLEIVEELIPNEIFRVLNSKDVGVIIFAVIFHDMGMHTSPDMFKKMIEGKYDEAIECYTKGMDADPYNPVLPTNRASAYFRLKK